MSKKLPALVQKINQYLSFPEVKEEGKIISFSQLQMYNDCPLKWDLNYKQGLREDPFSIHLTFGTSLHETVQHYLDLYYNKTKSEADGLNLEKHFYDRLIENYKNDVEKNKDQHFSSAQELDEFYQDGVNILSFIKKNKQKYFSKRGWHLLGCEIPIKIKLKEKIIFVGYVDLILYDESNNKVHIYDIKTSKNSWGSWNKKDEIKQAQVLLYKQFFSQQFDFPVENIYVEFFILKRKLWEQSDFPQKHIQQFAPSQGSWKLKQSVGYLEKFIKDCFEDDGSYKDINHKAIPGIKCKFCPFNNKKELCSSGISS